MIMQAITRTGGRGLPASAPRSIPRPIPLLTTAFLVAVTSGAAACGDAGTVRTEGTPGSPPGATSTTAPTAPSGTASATGTAGTATAGTATAGASAPVPYPAGSALAVVGVRHDTVLRLRKGPGTNFPVATALDPTADGATSRGHGWRSGSTWWIEVSAGGATGWADVRFLAGRGGTEDVTATVIDRLGSRPTAETMLELGRTVAEAMASREPPSSIVMSVAPSVGDLGEVSYDVVGLGDDSVRAERLHVFGRPTTSGESFSLRNVEATYFCARGSATGGPCP